MNRWTPFNKVSITLGFGFLYLPILLLIVYSFNESKLVTVWGGFSTKWYASLLENQALKDAAWVPIYFQRDVELISPRVTGLRESLFGHLPHTTVKLQ